jgi:hypothetical protein
MENKNDRTNINTPKKKHSFTTTQLVCTLLVIALIFLGLSEYANLHQEEIGKKIAETMANPSGSSATASASALPNELTNTNSVLILVNKTA